MSAAYPKRESSPLPDSQADSLSAAQPLPEQVSPSANGATAGSDSTAGERNGLGNRAPTNGASLRPKASSPNAGSKDSSKVSSSANAVPLEVRSNGSTKSNGSPNGQLSQTKQNGAVHNGIHYNGTGQNGTEPNDTGSNKHKVNTVGQESGFSSVGTAARTDISAARSSNAVTTNAMNGSQPSKSTPVQYSGNTYKDGDYRWNRGTYSKPQRFIDIWSFVLKLLSKRWLYNKAWTYGGNVTPEKQTKRREEIAVWLRETCLSLGPTFIKIGQLFSTRADLFPIEYVNELSKLQDRVPAFSYEQVKTTIESDFGRPLTELYQSFEPVPIAAASLGQVHIAQLHSGEEVVVKIQRPGLTRLFAIDLAILKGIAHYFQNHKEWGKGRDWIGIYEECCRLLWLEIDFLNEGRNGDKFRRNFRGVEWVNVPRIYWRYTSPRVLTMEYMPGIKISHYEAIESAGLDRKRLAKLGAEAYLRQLLTDGFFHADPHPGNIAVNPANGALIFYDFGMMGQVEAITRSRLMDTFVGIAQRDAQQVMAALVELGALAEIDDMGPVRRSIQYILDNLMDKPFEEQSVAAISDDLYAVAYDQPFRFPATFTFVMRAFSTLEGVGKGLDPEFNFMEAAKPYANELMTNGSPSEPNGLLGEISRQAAQVGTSALSLPKRLENTLDRLDRGDIRVRVRSIESDRIMRRNSNLSLVNSYALLVGTFTLSATMLMVFNFIWPSVVMGVIAAITGIALIRLLMKISRADRMP